MADKDATILLSKESGSLSPIPDGHRQGLMAVATLAGLSFVSSSIALLYLSFKLIRWHIKKRRESKSLQDDDLSDRPFDGRDFQPRMLTKNRKKAHPNQFLVLILNLLLADIHQAAAFLLNAVWVRLDAIEVGSRTCFAQGWLVSTGDLSSSLFITAIAVHTYLAIVWNYKPPQWAVYVTIVFLWVFNYQMAILGPAITQNGRDFGGFYVRAAAWCWINVEYEKLRLTLHYLFIFISLAITSILYTLIFLSIRKRPSTESQPGGHHHHHKAFFLYPVIYVVCTAPVALGRIVSMTDVRVPISYFCVAGALITSNGWLDVLLWGLTRRSLLFYSEVDSEDNGLDTFTFMRTPQDRKYGNIVWVEGASGVGDRSGISAPHRRRQQVDVEKSRNSRARGWPGSRKVDEWRRERDEAKRQHKTASQESLRRVVSKPVERAGPGMGIQMDMITSVVVERDIASRGSRGSRVLGLGKTPCYLGMNRASNLLGPDGKPVVLDVENFGKYPGPGK